MFAINNYLSSKELIEMQIKNEEKYIEEATEKIKLLMQNDICLLNLKTYGHYSALDRCYETITIHQENIENMKKGDIKFLFELISKEEKNKQMLINSQIMNLIERIEEIIEYKQQPEWYKPDSMTVDEFIETNNTYQKKLKNYIERLLDGDFELYNELIQSEREN